MPSDENKRLVRRYYEEIVNTGDISSIENFIGREYTEVYEGKRHVIGVKGAKDHILGVRRTYPDLHITIDQQIAEVEWVVSCITAKGTHKGTWLGIKPTGKPVVFTGVNVDRVVNGRIVEHGGAANMLGPLLEIGAIKVVDSE
jgi:predicted ester cyclase